MLLARRLNALVCADSLGHKDEGRQEITGVLTLCALYDTQCGHECERVL